MVQEKGHFALQAVNPVSIIDIPYSHLSSTGVISTFKVRTNPWVFPGLVPKQKTKDYHQQIHSLNIY